MPEIIFSGAEKAEIDRLVAKHSPINDPTAAPALRLLQQETRDQVVTGYETMLRAVAETAYTVLLSVDDLIARSEPADFDDSAGFNARRDLVRNLQDLLLALGVTHLVESTDAILRALSGPGDSEVSEACFRLGPDLIQDILATRGLSGLLGGGTGLARPGEISLAHATIKKCS
jgi:hypothetical protein